MAVTTRSRGAAAGRKPSAVAGSAARWRGDVLPKGAVQELGWGGAGTSAHRRSTSLGCLAARAVLLVVLLPSFLVSCSLHRFAASRSPSSCRTSQPVAARRSNRCPQVHSVLDTATILLISQPLFSKVSAACGETRPRSPRASND